MTREALGATARSLAERFPWVDAVYLFGSRAEGRSRPSSDVDLAIFSSAAPEDRLAAEAELARFAEEGLGVPVDAILIRRDLPPALLFAIFAVETPLYARDPEQAHSVACRARAEYRDLHPRLERAFARLRQRIEERAHALRRA